MTFSFVINTHEIHICSRENSTLRTTIHAKHIIYLSHILANSARKTVINPNPFNMQISTPPTARGLHICFILFFFPLRTSFNRRCNSYSWQTSGAILFVEYVIIIFISFSVAPSSRYIHVYLHCRKNMYKDKRM